MPEILTVELKRPDSSQSWGICFAVLPDGPEILRACVLLLVIQVMRESPAFGRLKNGQVIKRVNGQPVLGLTREEIGELLAAGDEDLILDVQDPLPIDYRIREFGHEYNRRSVEPSGLPRRQSEVALLTRRRDSNASNSSHKFSTTDTPNVLHEFERIHQQRKQSREITLSYLENARMQRCVSVDRPIGPVRTPPAYPNRWMPAGMPRPAVPNGLPYNGEQFKPDSEQPTRAEIASEKGEKEEQVADSMSSLRYMGMQIPSRTFRALASLLGMDDPHNASIEAASKDRLYLLMNSSPPDTLDSLAAATATPFAPAGIVSLASGLGQPCRTVIDVRAKAEEMRLEAEKRASLSGPCGPECDILSTPDTPASPTVNPA
ncbi:unnamed protein product [Schistocephalus solidus]|uniref:PDZ domain-containing protein n=1 Tax=Schistocephalus solidus TaxID=70667 RepID=A0A183SLB6_SCHSO|nr:unnamed protein product [Schistocephalus solidus]